MSGHTTTDAPKTLDRKNVSSDVAKLYIDFFKHLTTLSTGTAVIFISITTHLRPELKSDRWTIVALVLLAVSVLASLLAMAGVADARHRLEQDVDRPWYLWSVNTCAQFWAPFLFIAGIAAFIYAAM